jgi:hypothetical protein
VETGSLMTASSAINYATDIEGVFCLGVVQIVGRYSGHWTRILLRAVVRDSFGAPIDRVCKSRLLLGALAVPLSRDRTRNSW